MREGGLGEKERGVGVDRHHAAVLLDADVADVLGPGDAGDVAEDVEAAVGADGGGERGGAGGRVGEVGDVGRHGPAAELDALVEALGVDVDDDDPGALAGEAQGDGPTDARARPGDEGHPVGEARLRHGGDPRVAAVRGEPTYVLIHGGGTTGRFWDRLLPHLDGPALAVDLPGRGDRPADLPTLTVDDEVASVLADVEASAPPGDAVVVAHSSGGLVVPGVLAGLGDRVRHVVLNAASVPPEGGCGLDCMQPRHADGVRLALRMAEESGRPLLTTGPPEDPEAFRRAYGGPPLDDDVLAFVVDPVRCVVDTMNHYLQPVRWSAAPAVPVTYVATTLDRPVPIDLQREMIGRLPSPPVAVVELESGHIPPVVDPEGFAALVRSAA